jgi:hypothetical protein
MTSWQDIAEAVGGALALGWAVFVEYRLRLAQDANAQLNRKYEDKVIEDNVHALSDSQLSSDLHSELGGGSPSKPKA